MQMQCKMGGFLSPAVHNWDKWEIVEEKTEDYTTAIAVKIKWFVKQKRVCRDCNYTEINIQTVTK